MGKLQAYLGQRKRRGATVQQIEKDLLKAGYSKEAVKGAFQTFDKHQRIAKWAGISAISLVLVGVLFFLGSGIGGMLTLKYAKNSGDPLGMRIVENGDFTWVPQVSGMLTEISLNGSLIGPGSAKVFLIDKNNKPYLIIDTAIDHYTWFQEERGDQESSIRFVRACYDTCSLPNLQQAAYTIRVALENADLEIDSIGYQVTGTKDQEVLPSWQPIPSEETDLNGRLVFDLTRFFKTQDAKFRTLSSDSIVSVEIQHPLAVVMPKREGVSRLYFLADVNGATYISNLVEIHVVAGVVADNSTQKTIENSPKELQSEVPTEISPRRLAGMNILLFSFFALLAAVALTFIFLFAKGMLARKHLTKEEVVLEELFEAFKKSPPGEKEALYRKMKSLYEAMLASPLPPNEKKRMYAKLLKCYHDLK